MTRTRIRKPMVQSQPGTGLANFLLGLVIGFGACYLFNPQPSVIPRPDDEKRQVQPDDTVKFIPGFIYFVHDRQSLSVNDVQLLDATDEFCNQHQGLGVRQLISATNLKVR